MTEIIPFPTKPRCLALPPLSERIGECRCAFEAEGRTPEEIEELLAIIFGRECQEPTAKGNG